MTPREALDFLHGVAREIDPSPDADLFRQAIGVLERYRSPDAEALALSVRTIIQLESDLASSSKLVREVLNAFQNMSGRSEAYVGPRRLPGA
jgi:hypothetical protein